MAKFVLNLLFTLGLFGMFVPFGYLPLYWAIPTSISFFLLSAGCVFAYKKVFGEE